MNSINNDKKNIFINEYSMIKKIAENFNFFTTDCHNSIENRNFLEFFLNRIDLYNLEFELRTKIIGGYHLTKYSQYQCTKNKNKIYKFIKKHHNHH